MSAVTTLVLLTFGSVGAVAGLAGAFWLALKIMRVPFGPPNIVGVLIFAGLAILSTAILIAYLENQP